MLVVFCLQIKVWFGVIIEIFGVCCTDVFCNDAKYLSYYTLVTS